MRRCVRAICDLYETLQEEGIMDYAAGQAADMGVSAAKYLIVSVNGFDYAVNVSFIHKIVALPLSRISFLPRVEPYILGSIKADGGIYTVVDLRILFGKKPEISQKPAVAVLLVYGASGICAVVDDVTSVIDIDTEYAVCPLEGNPHISGIVQIDNKIIGLLCVERLFRQASSD